MKPKFRTPLLMNSRPRLILDIGVANDSYRECKAVFPDATYHGLDHVDPNVMVTGDDRLLLADLEHPGALESVTSSYDLILANHVLEHVARGHEVYAGLCQRLAAGGLLYAEFPSLRTAIKPKRARSYHFHDDPTHKRLYVLEDLANIAMDQGCRIVSCGPISTPCKDLLALPRAALALLRGEPHGPYLVHLQRRIDHILVRRA